MSRTRRQRDRYGRPDRTDTVLQYVLGGIAVVALPIIVYAVFFYRPGG